MLWIRGTGMPLSVHPVSLATLHVAGCMNTEGITYLLKELGGLIFGSPKVVISRVGPPKSTDLDPKIPHFHPIFTPFLTHLVTFWCPVVSYW